MSVSLKEYLNHPVIRIIAETAGEAGNETYIIGGFVRDILLGRASKDIDIVTVGSGIDLAQSVASKLGPTVHVNYFKNFGTAMLKYNQIEVEFVGARKESYTRESRKPVVENGTLEEDQKRRDFTVNAMAIGLNSWNFGELTDPFGGLGDLKARIIRTPLNPDITFSDDPLRMLRAIRFSAQLKFTIDDRTLTAIATNRHRITIVSEERIIDELNKIILSSQPSSGFIQLEETGLLAIIFPELNNLKGVDAVKGIAHKDNFYHTLKVLDRLAENSDNLWLRWAALLHDIAKPATKKYVEGQGWTFHGHNFLGAKMVPRIFKRMKLPLNDKMKYVQKIVDLHMRPISLSDEVVTDSAVRRLLFDAGDDIDDLMTLCEADITSKVEEKVKKHLRNFSLVRQKLIEIEQKDAVRNFQPPITGEVIMKTFGLQPGREVGIIKETIKNAILDGEISNNLNEAYDLMIRKGASLGLTPVPE